MAEEPTPTPEPTPVPEPEPEPEPEPAPRPGTPSSVMLWPYVLSAKERAVLWNDGRG